MPIIAGKNHPFSIFFPHYLTNVMRPYDNRADVGDGGVSPVRPPSCEISPLVLDAFELGKEPAAPVMPPSERRRVREREIIPGMTSVMMMMPMRVMTVYMVPGLRPLGAREGEKSCKC